MSRWGRAPTCSRSAEPSSSTPRGSSSRRLRDVVLDGKSTVIVDLSDVAELGSSLIGALIRTQRSLNWRNGRLLIACESAAIRHQLADLNDIFEFVDARPQRR